MSLKSRFLDPDLVRRLGRAEVKARQTVEGFLTGLHTSPYRGFSVEFAEHRSYVPGDDPRHIDWKVYGRRERYYIKQYHEETNFVATILLDASESMTFSSSRMSKLEYGCILATALSLIVLRQNDAAALGLFDRQATGYLPPGTRLPFIARLAEVLDRIQPTGRTDIAGSLEQYTRLVARRGIIVVISDFLDNPAAILKGLRKLKFAGHEVVAINVLDPHELEFPLKGHIRFEGIELDARVRVEPHRIRDAYLDALEKHLHAVRVGCSRSGIDHRLASTAEPVEELLLGYLATRHKVRRVAR
ncbi:MAG: DUF58 domain-containing protein [Planctomycetes bacterium]|nr:DUF58 domain-containing protein [Planctomycetota bacterium]